MLLAEELRRGLLGHGSVSFFTIRFVPSSLRFVFVFLSLSLSLFLASFVLLLSFPTARMPPPGPSPASLSLLAVTKSLLLHSFSLFA